MREMHRMGSGREAGGPRKGEAAAESRRDAGLEKERPATPRGKRWDCRRPGKRLAGGEAGCSDRRSQAEATDARGREGEVGRWSGVEERATHLSRRS